MVMRTIEIKETSFEVEKERQGDVIKKIEELYPDLEVSKDGDEITVKGDLRNYSNYRKREMVIYIISYQVVNMGRVYRPVNLNVV